MNITEIKNDNTDFHVKVIIPATNINSEIDKELVKIAKTAKIDGFRVGKVPTSFLKKKYGLSVRADAVKNSIVKAMTDIAKDKNLRTFADPEIADMKNEDGKDLEFTLKYQLLPEITMPNFKKISIEKPVLKVEDKDVEEHLKTMSELFKDYSKESKTKAKNGDQVTIDAIGYVNGKEFAGGKLEAHKLVLGSGAFIPGFEDQLIGTKAGMDVSVKVDFPENYHAKELAGQPSEFKVKVLAVHNEGKSKIDDEFAKKFNAQNLEELKKQVAENFHRVYEDQIQTIMKMELFDKLEGQMSFDVPKSLLDREVNILEKQISQNENEDEELKGKSEKEKKDYFAKLASRRVKIGLMLAEYVKLQQLQIDKSDINKAVLDQAKSFPGRENEVINFYIKNSEALESLKGPILEEKAVNQIFEKEVKLVEKSYSKNALDKMLAKVEDEHSLGGHVHGPDCNHDHD